MSQNIAILGAGISGQAARRLAEARGHATCVFDERGEGDSDAFTAEVCEAFDSIVISPGFAHMHPWRQIAAESSKSCFGEIGFAAQQWQGKLIAVTGTNGKSTITKFLAQALQNVGWKAVATGNIGYPLSDAVLSEANHPDGYAILEVSSFQAELPQGLEIDWLIWTNFAEDHLDRYDSMAEYFLAKANLLGCLTAAGVCVISPQVRDWMKLMKTDFDTCSVAHRNVDQSALLSLGSTFQHFPQSDNFSLLAELWRKLDLPVEALIETANSFWLAPHRLKLEATGNGVQFWNDSKATNFHASLAALSSMKGQTFWIGGGQAKGGDIEVFLRDLATHIEGAFVYGEIGPRLVTELQKMHKNVQIFDKFHDAVFAAAEAATLMGNANVLLSPGFSSFDQFSSYEARGKCFISLVLSLNGVQATH